MEQGIQGTRTYRYSTQRVRETHRRKPDPLGNLSPEREGSEIRCLLSNAPEDTLQGAPGLGATAGV